ncbi:MAG: F0F1 ATP synthase subunit B [Bacillota bacterium]|jgi:F-type H+-transporting ATPase subunit b
MSIDLNTLIWAIINFFVLLAILYKFLYKPVLNVLDSRKEEIANNLSHAEASRKEAEEMFSDYKKQLEKATLEAAEIINKANKTAEEAKDEIIAQARQEAAAISEKAQKEIIREKEKAMQEVRDEIAGLAVLAAGKVLEKSITKEDHEKMISDFVSQVGNVQ